MSEAITHRKPSSELLFSPAPAPWNCKADTYWILYNQTGPLPEDAYAPLEANTPTFSSPSLAGKFHGGNAMLQIVRYKDSPVGSYNELMVLPGLFDVPNNAEGKNRGKKRKTLRITRIYVDQKETTYNGRVNWNIPKHLARFSFERLSSPTRLKVQLFPPSSSPSNSETEKPFISITLQPFVYVPALPFSTKVLPWLGLDGALTQPPLLPQPDGGKGLAPELRAGSEEWLQTTSVVRCEKMRGCWVDYEQPSSADGNAAVVENKGWFPTVHPYRFGMWLEGAEIAVPIAEVL